MGQRGACKFCTVKYNANSFTLTNKVYLLQRENIQGAISNSYIPPWGWCCTLVFSVTMTTREVFLSCSSRGVLLVFNSLQVHFDPPPIFVSLPYSSTGVGGRRWRVWQSQLSSLGKVYPIILPDSLTDPTQGISLTELAEQMVITSLGRVREVRGCEG